jgi:hypothetical protein
MKFFMTLASVGQFEYVNIRLLCSSYINHSSLRRWCLSSCHRHDMTSRPLDFPSVLQAIQFIRFIHAKNNNFQNYLFMVY